MLIAMCIKLQKLLKFEFAKVFFKFQCVAKSDSDFWLLSKSVFNWNAQLLIMMTKCL